MSGGDKTLVQDTMNNVDKTATVNTVNNVSRSSNNVVEIDLVALFYRFLEKAHWIVLTATPLSACRICRLVPIWLPTTKKCSRTGMCMSWWIKD